MARGLDVDIAIYRALIRKFCKGDNIRYAQKVFSLMQGKGILGDSIVYSNLAYAYLKAGKPILASEMLDDMIKRYLMINVKIYKSLNDSFSNDSDILRLFWGHVVERVQQLLWSIRNRTLVKKVKKFMHKNF
ncbi:Pentatricopeptide repeat-containing protein [Thalictrum thalictroides]|uniref:Pentatricopeptide repeat-containing protein n=1 Tax=Thalictrum thalictroides TaxID=46969 RepID=A0A7J6WRZ3_THATH|nr:Pentatricopeptide repeat-containing protein [Thalictrum thalictroides]